MAEHNFATSGPKHYYNAKGQNVLCSSKDDVARAREAGYTSANYVPSYWPKMAYNKKTGVSKPVGKIENTDEQNADAVKKLGDEWTLDYVATPEPVVAAPAGQAAGTDLTALVAMATDIALMKNRIVDLEEAAIQGEAVRVAQETRITELESIVESASAPVDTKKK